ncbi:MAG: hypothetical protein CL910_02640 [Deltaproteobacteria bacterium]|nr:hypothetical protein [Deltaproteobacteria bacterium]
MVSGVSLTIYGFFSVNATGILLWTVASWVLLELCRSRDRRLWLVLGGVLGLALLNKHTAAVPVAGVVVATLASPLRHDLRSPWPWLGALAAASIVAPNLYWQVANGWPSLAFYAGVEESRYTASALDQVVLQVLAQNPASFPILGGRRLLPGLVSAGTALPGLGLVLRHGVRSGDRRRVEPALPDRGRLPAGLRRWRRVPGGRAKARRGAPAPDLEHLDASLLHAGRRRGDCDLRPADPAAPGAGAAPAPRPERGRWSAIPPRGRHEPDPLPPGQPNPLGVVRGGGRERGSGPRSRRAGGCDHPGGLLRPRRSPRALRAGSLAAGLQPHDRLLPLGPAPRIAHDSDLDRHRRGLRAGQLRAARGGRHLSLYLLPPGGERPADLRDGPSETSIR